MKDVKDLKKKKMNVKQELKPKKMNVEQDFRLKKTSEGLSNKLRKQHVWQVYRRKKRIG